MQFIRTSKATDWERPSPSIVQRFARALLGFIPRSNPDYESKLHLVHEWLIEFDERGLPHREIGITKNGKPVIAGPNKENYGFWLDTNMSIADFCDAPLTRDEFETTWKEAVEKLKL
ncbi:hypothetical protein IB232_05460 [Pseudomonas sp. PDM15]|uniref:hypothetical protein n=1 Tax=Pseudomonas sp. PDM15 TaxID=2769303 RepID=UPI00177F0781|nr:hypothetical protein [Pseudomonas sp. PDM15]MBD9424761.1 hypothetical protein [Pseudomonas sp. PDM15]